jgi:hypothetical protein
MTDCRSAETVFLSGLLSSRGVPVVSAVTQVGNRATPKTLLSKKFEYTTGTLAPLRR